MFREIICTLLWGNVVIIVFVVVAGMMGKLKERSAHGEAMQ